MAESNTASTAQPVMASTAEDTAFWAFPATSGMGLPYWTGRLVQGVDEHGAELDGYIEKYAKGWKFSRIPLVA